MAADWTKKNILAKLFPNKYDYNNKQKFMNGIQSIAFSSNEIYKTPKNKLSSGQKQQGSKGENLRDYTKQEQIRFTIQYFHLNKGNFNNPKSDKCREVLRYLNKL